MLYAMGSVLMNFYVAKTIVSTELFSIAGGIVLTWVPFLCNDIVSRSFGKRIANTLNFFTTGVVIIVTVLSHLMTLIPSAQGDSAAFDSVFGSVWWISLASILAFCLSALLNTAINCAITKAMSGKNETGSYYAAVSASTFAGQVLDNIMFGGLAFGIFAPIFWGWGWSLTQIIGGSIISACIELVVELIFAPIGHHICLTWKKKGIVE